MTSTARTLLTGVHHVGIHTAEPERLLSFYRDVFDVAPRALPGSLTQGCAYFELDDGAAVEVIAVAGQAPAGDHIAFAVSDRRDLFVLRERLMAAGHSAGAVRDLGSILSLDFHDPDGRRGEVVWVKEGTRR